MARLTILFCFFSLIFISELSAQTKRTVKKQKAIRVNLSITSTMDWCGGARPTEEMEREFKTKQPYSNLGLYLRKDSNDLTKPIIYSIETNALGKSSLMLTPGKYIVVNDQKKDTSIYQTTLKKFALATETTGPIDTICYKKFIAEPDFVILVPKKSTRPLHVKYNYHKHCDWSGAPCVEFRGPYPP